MSLFKKPNELSVNPTIKMLIYGQPGIGKTSLALSAPRPVLLDFDGGIHRVNGAFQCPTLQVLSWDEVLMALKEDLSDFETIVVDTAGKMLDYMSAYIIKNESKYGKRDGSLSLQGYGVRKNMFIQFLKQVSMLNKNLVVVAHEKEEKDGEVRIVRPEMGGSSAGDLIKELDLVGYMQAVGEDRTIFWTPQEKFYAKNTCNLPPAHKIPSIIDINGSITGQNSFLTNVFNSYYDYLKVQSNIKNDYQAIIEQVLNDIEKVTDATTANSVKDKILAYNHVWDSRIRTAKMLNDKCKKLGLNFNQATKSYESEA